MAKPRLPKNWNDVYYMRVEYEGYVRGYAAGQAQQPPDVTLEDLEALRRIKPCNTCTGDGTMDHWEEVVVCPACGGNGIAATKVPV